MADLKISQLGSIVTVVPATDVLPVVQGGTTLKITPKQILESGSPAVLASATITGAATVGTTLGVTGASTLASVGVTGAATVGTTLLVGTNATLTNGNVIIGTSGKGIDFSAVTGGTGTATANVLNDYEEGTFVPTLSGSTTNPTTTQSGTGRYTKVGRQVTVQIFFNNVTTVGASGQILVNGLPFANNGTVEAIADTAFYNMATFTGVPFGLVPVNVSQIQIYSSQSNGVFLPVTYNAGAVQYLWANLTYTV